MTKESTHATNLSSSATSLHDVALISRRNKGYNRLVTSLMKFVRWVQRRWKGT